MVQNVKGRVVVEVDITKKDSYEFGNGQKIIMFRNTNNFDRRYTQPVNGIVISASEIPKGSEVLLEHNSCHPTNEIFDYNDDEPNIKYYSVPEMEVYVWRYVKDLHYGLKSKKDATLEELETQFALNTNIPTEYLEQWHPAKYYAIGERVFKPYKGSLVGIEPERIKNTLLIKTGEFKNKIVHTLANSDYVIIYQDTDGKPNEILTVFHVENEEELDNPRISSKEEIVAIDMGLTEQWLNGELLTGLTANDCKAYLK